MCISWKNKSVSDNIDARCKHEYYDRRLIYVTLNQYITVSDSETTFCVNTVIPLFVKEKLWVELRFSSLQRDFLKKKPSCILLL